MDDLDLFLVTEHALWHVNFKEFDKKKKREKKRENMLRQIIKLSENIMKLGKEMMPRKLKRRMHEKLEGLMHEEMMLGDDMMLGEVHKSKEMMLGKEMKFHESKEMMPGEDLSEEMMPSVEMMPGEELSEEMMLGEELSDEEMMFYKEMMLGEELSDEEMMFYKEMMLGEELSDEEMMFYEETMLRMKLKLSEVMKPGEEFTRRQEIKGDLPRGPVWVDSEWYFVGSQRVMRKDINGFGTWTNLNVVTLMASDLCFQNLPCLESPSLEDGARSKRIDPIVVPIGQEIFVLEKRPFFDYKGTAFSKTPIFQVFNTVSQSWSNLTPPPFYNPGSSNGMSSHYISSYFSWGRRLAISTFASGSFIYEVEEKEWKNVKDILRPGFMAFSCAIELEDFLIGMPFDQQLLVACKLDGNGLPMSQYQVLETLEDDLFYRPLQKPSSGFLTHFSKDNHIFFMYDGLDGYNRWVARIAVFQVFIPKGAADTLVVTLKKLHRYDLGPLNSFELEWRSGEKPADRISCQPNIYSAFFM